MLIDTHVHLYHKRYDSDRDEMIKRAKEAGVEIMLMPAIDVASIGHAIELASQHEGLYSMSAIHPSETKEASDEDFQKVREYCDHENVIAVGESGLDYYWDRSFDTIQHDFLRRHVRLAIEKDLPLILHNRESTDDLIEILLDEKSKSTEGEKLRGIFHCFSGTKDDAERMIDLGFILGLGGTLTFKNSGVADAVAEISLEHIVLETDGPFLAPVPHRGKRNESAYVPLVAEKLAEVKGLSVEEISSLTTANARKIFRL